MIYFLLLMYNYVLKVNKLLSYLKSLIIIYYLYILFIFLFIFYIR